MGFAKYLYNVITSTQTLRLVEGTQTFYNNSEKVVKEDMLAVSDAPGTVIVNPEVPGQLMQTPQSLAGDMDTFSLLGPGKKTKSNKKKKKKAKSSPEIKVNNRVSSFSDFMQRK